MSKNNALLLNFPKKAVFIFIFSIIVVYFLTTVSKNAFAFHFSPIEKGENIQTPEDLDTLLKVSFEDGRLMGWKQISDWEVSPSEKISGASSMKHGLKNIAGTSLIFHPLAVNCNQSDLSWSFQLKNGNWDPSSSNSFWFYLGADTIESELINGWAAGVNMKGNSDLLELWRLRNGKPDSLIIQSDLDWNASTLASIDITRSAQGHWKMYYLKAGEAVSQTFLGTDASTFPLKNIGLCFNYTQTRAGQLWLDDVEVTSQPAEIFIQKLKVENSHTIALTFNKPIDPSSLQINHFQLSDENGLSIPLLSLTPGPSSSQRVDLELGTSTGVELTLSVSGVSDFKGLVMKPVKLDFSFSFLPEPASVLINEVLFNPLTGGVDFVELVNVSPVPVSVHHLILATRNDTLALKQVYALSSTVRYLKPSHFLTCTKDPQAVMSFYLTNDPQTFCQMTYFPTYADEAGAVVLVNDSMEVIDELIYTEKMHSPFLANRNGVSLERISLNRPTSDKTNWTSAASSAGFATPGMPNSQANAEDTVEDQILPDPVVFSPNGDGFNDVLTIHFNLSQPGYLANVRIYDVTGRCVKFLVKNESLSQQGSWTWKGDSHTSQRLNMGVYIILVELFDRDGHSKIYKKICTLTDRRG